MLDADSRALNPFKRRSVLEDKSRFFLVLLR